MKIANLTIKKFDDLTRATRLLWRHFTGPIGMRSYFSIYLIFLSSYSFASQEIPELIVKKIEQGVFLHKSFSRVDGYGLVSSNGLVVVDDGKAFIVDTPWSEQDTEKLVNWIQANNYELLGSISTHSHQDRTAGIKWLNDHSISTYATNLTNDILKAEKKEQAKYALKENEFSLANGLLDIFYPGGAHSIDNIVVWLPKSKILFGGCLVRSLESRGLGNTSEAHIKHWPNSIENALAKYASVRMVIPGHGEIGDIALLKHTKKLAESAANKK